MTKTEARIKGQSMKKQRTANKNTIIFPAEENPRGPDVNNVIKRNFTA